MNESEAYRRSYHERALAEYTPGSIVKVGPAYRMGGTYEADGWEGVFTVIRRCSDGPDYYVARGRHQDLNGLDWDGIVHASRLEPVLRCDKEKDCVRQVTHVDHKGHVYCGPHARRKIDGIRPRELRAHEVKQLEQGGTIRY